jgi:hypothetical protein
MSIAILAVWTIGVLGALVATLVILKQSFLVARALLDIARLGEITEQAAQGIAANTAVVLHVRDAAAIGESLTNTVERVGRALDVIGRRVRA